MSDIITCPIYCIKCNERRELKMDQFDKGQFLTCKKCGTKFNVYGVYLSFYNELPVAKQIVDALTTEIGVNYLVESPDPFDEEKIKHFFEENQFNVLLKDVVFDAVIFGNSFVEKTRRREKTILRRIDPTTIEVKTSWQRGAGKGFTMGIEKLIQYFPKRRETRQENIIHFSGGDSLGEPLGFSVYGFWFHVWSLLKFPPDKKSWEYARNEVVIGSGVPLFKIDTTIKVPLFLQIIPMTRFQMNVQRRRKRIARTIEREIFPLALGRPFEFEKYPRFKF